MNNNERMQDHQNAESRKKEDILSESGARITSPVESGTVTMPSEAGAKREIAFLSMLLPPLPSLFDELRTQFKNKLAPLTFTPLISRNSLKVDM